jgi:glutathione S-transferase
LSGSKLVVYGFPGGWSTSSASPFCVKLETWLRMAGIPYEAVSKLPPPERPPRGKFPFVRIGGRLISDSRMIVEHLAAQHGVDLDAGLSARERAVGHAVCRMLEESTYFVVLHDRWVDEDGWAVVREAYFGFLPPVVKQLLPWWLRHKVVQQLWGQGTGRLTPDEIASVGLRDVEAVIDVLGDRPFLLGDQPHTADATAYAFIASVLWAPVPSAVRDRVLEAPTLVAYCERMRDRYWPEHAAKALAS